jgi:hypothetical protein
LDSNRDITDKEDDHEFLLVETETNDVMLHFQVSKDGESIELKNLSWNLHYKITTSRKIKIITEPEIEEE